MPKTVVILFILSTMVVVYEFQGWQSRAAAIVVMTAWGITAQVIYIWSGV